MSLLLHELLVCCRGLENEKVTERKKEVERFRQLIRSPDTIQELDRNSGTKSSKGSKQLTWDAVFKFLQRYLQKETEALHSGKANVSAATQANRHKKMQEISSLVKYFIRCANKRGPRLKCADLLYHIMDVLRSSYSCAAYGEDYSSLLLKDILSVRKYWCEVTRQQWCDLLDLYCGFFNAASRAINRVLVSRIIHTVVKGCCSQTDGLTHTLFSFFSKALLHARKEKHLVVVEHLVSALNIFLRSSAMNCRIRVCQLGEELLPSVLYIWAQMRPSPMLKEELVEFFSLQLCVHHPTGAKTEDTGAYAEDWTKWQSLLYNLYDVLVSEIGQIGSRGKYVTGSRHIAVKENIIELTADICHQLFSQETQVLEVTQAHLRTTQWECPQTAPSKRRRIELGWEVLRDHLQPSKSDFDIIPWLQISSMLASKYPSLLPGKELVPLLSTLCQLLSEQRRGERGPYVLRCLREVARCQALHPDRVHAQGPELHKLWSRIWTLAIRGAGFPQTEALSQDLLETIIQGGLIPIDKEFWKLFSSSAYKPSRAAATCLAQALLKCAPLKLTDPGPDHLAVEGFGPPSFKELSISWLLNSNQSEETEEGSKPHLIVCRDFPDLLIPRILVSLTLKDTRSGMLFLKDSPVSESSSALLRSCAGKEDLCEMERMYLQFSFDEELCPAVKLTSTASLSGDPQVTVVQGLKDKVQKDLLFVADNLLNCYSPESQSTPPECLVRCCTLLTGVLGAYVCTGILSEEDARGSSLFQKAKSLARHLNEYIGTVKGRMTDDGILSTLKTIMRLCTDGITRGTKDRMRSVSCSLFLSSLPSRLLTELCEICKMMLTNPSKKGSVAVDEDHMEDDLEMTRTQADDLGHIDLIGGGEPVASSSGSKLQKVPDGAGVQHSTGAQSALAEELLTNQELALLASLRFLCLCASAEFTHGLSFKPPEIRHRLLLLVDQIDLAKPLHLNMYLTLLNKIPAVDTSLTAEDFDSLLSPLADLCSLYRQDQEVCATILQGLLSCICSLSQTQDPAEDMRHVQGALLKVVSGFCMLARTGKSIAPVRVALVQCLVTLLEADPCCKWAVLTLPEEEPVSAVLPSFLADPHHHVRMKAALFVDRLFLEMSPDHLEEKKMLSLQLQQAAFENVYLKAQEGMQRKGGAPEEQRDEVFNRRSTLLKSVSGMLACSPVCEKQAIFALFQSHRENSIDQQLIKKVLRSVAQILGYRSPENLVRSHLDYLVTEWLRQRRKEPGYTLESFPYALLGHVTLEDFYRSSYHVLVPHLVFLDDFEQVKSIGAMLNLDWKQLLANCFPKIMVNILPHFALPASDSQVAVQRETANRVYDLLKDANCLGKQQIDSLIHSNLADIVVELLMTLYEEAGLEAEEGGELHRFIGQLDPAPNPPYFSSYVIKATLDYLSKCHSTNVLSLVAILSKTPVSIQKVLFAICQKASETTNAYEKHRILLMYHLFVSFLLKEIKDGLGGAWAFILRDVIYTLIHHINSRPAHLDEVSTRSFSLCCDLLTSVCRTAVHFSVDALESHLQVIVGTLTAQVTDQSAVSQQVLDLLKFLVIDCQDNERLKQAIQHLEPFPAGPAFRKLRASQQALKYSEGTFTLREEITHFLSVSPCDTLPMTRLEGLKDLRMQLSTHKGAIRKLLLECQADPVESVLMKLVLNLLQISKMAVNHPGGRDVLEAVGSCLGELGPVDLSTIALLHEKDQVNAQAAKLFPDLELQWTFIVFNCMNSALIHPCIKVRQASVQCLKAILATRTGSKFWEAHKDSRDSMLVYFSPLRSTKKKTLEDSAEPKPGSREQLDSSELWVPQQGRHSIWLKTLCVALVDSGGVTSEALLLSRPLCEVKTDFCQKVLLLFIHDILLHDADGSWRTLLSSHIRDFFTCFSRAVSACSRSTTPLPADSGSESDISNQGLLDKSSLRTMLAVVDYLRQQKRPLEPDSITYGTVCQSNFWLDLNYLEVAQAAQWCSAHFTALLYTEIYMDKIRSDMEHNHRTQQKASTENSLRRIVFEESSQNFSIASLSERSVEDSGISLQDLLIEAYRSIGEPDSLYGCGAGKVVSPITRIRTYEHEALWGKALTSYDLHSSLPEVTRQVGILEALQNSGLCSTLATYLRGLESEGVEWGAELREKRFQAAWRSAQWDCDLSERSENLDPGFNESVFCALRALGDKELGAFDGTLKRARYSEVEELCRGSLEAVSSLYPTLCNLQRISELESVGQLCSRSVTEAGLAELYGGWQQHSQLLIDSDFSLLEPIMALRTTTQELLIGREQAGERKEHLQTGLTSHLMEMCKLARKAGNTQLAERAVFQMKRLGREGRGAAASAWQLEEAQVFWAQKEQGLALGILQQMIETLSGQVQFDSTLMPVLAECLRLCGNWLAETCLVSPGIVLEEYLEKAVKVIEDHQDGTSAQLESQKTQAFLSLARFSDAQYQSIVNYMKSSEFENKQALLEKAKVEVDLMMERKVNHNRYTVRVQRELELDERALANLQADRLRFLCKAVENYIQCLGLGEEHDMWVFRLASLWLENSDVKDVNSMMKMGAENIPSHKFLPLMYQLAARMGTKMSGAAADGGGFHDVLNELICRTSLDHPHHTLLIILALVNANQDESFTGSRLSKSALRQPSPMDKERTEVASKIINVVRKQRADLVRGTEILCNAYITLAYMDASRHKNEKKPIPIPSEQPITKIKDLDNVIIPTMEIKVDPTGKYDNLVTIKSFKPTYCLVGGVNLPKIIDCVGSDGKRRRQLVKGQDDLRQDAVMQQVFQMCSMLLQRNVETRKRKLNIRRYKVVPFSQRSGVLEWCSGTMPIGEFLVDAQKGAHKRFRPQDWTSFACRKVMMESQRKGFDEKVQAFNEVCQNFRPVFRYFCVERFLDPAVWLEKRLAYTRSVATCSIVGYIVGLGDRHIQNILIDEETAELVHIDLGVAFEQGKVLPTPETVPFRLSRDIVDGMGITGVEGVFRRCCEKTMEVMRHSQEALLTIVEVLLYDPLFDWTMNPLKAFYLQQQHEEAEVNATLNSTLGGEDLEAHRKSSGDAQSFNKVAERVLLRLQEKLKGVEEGTVLSVGGQVNLLIQQAMDPKNLSRLFPGWQAWV
ncbi:serine-protein kinase ATM [Paramormyrops kingsleyae]|uniref:serine-protein kinase ATM n=1 Tax=Paramormyrops kingsleyae TaxID=1676925 RepID=UPI003B970AB3